MNEASEPHLLLGPDGAPALAAAAAETEPDSLAAVARLRQRFGGELGAAALTQESLRRRGVAKLGERARTMYLTRDGLEQASRPDVAGWRAARYVAAGAVEVWDLGCGVGADALAFAAAGIAVVGVERDEQTAVFAAANLGSHVLVGDAESAEVPPDAWVYLDPARRDARGRVWTTAGLSPSWDFTLATLRSHGGAAKVGPGIAHRELPPDLGAEWVCHRGDVVECSVWTTLAPGEKAATLLPSGDRLVADDSPTPEATGPREFLLEPNGAAIRAACLPRLAREFDATLVNRDIAYLASDRAPTSPWVTAFQVLDSLPFREKVLRAWVAEHRIGTLEIKKRGVDVDPTMVRKALRVKGDRLATLVLTPTPDGVRALVCERVTATAAKTCPPPSGLVRLT